MGKNLFIMLFSMVTTVMLYTGLVYSIFMTLVTNESIQLISATIYDIGHKWFNIEFEAVTVLIIISILILIVIHMIITKISYVILRVIGRANIGSGGTYSGGNESSRRLDNKSVYDDHMDRLRWDKNTFPEKYETKVVWDSRKSGK